MAVPLYRYEVNGKPIFCCYGGCRRLVNAYTRVSNYSSNDLCDNCVKSITIRPTAYVVLEYITEDGLSELTTYSELGIEHARFISIHLYAEALRLAARFAKI